MYTSIKTKNRLFQSHYKHGDSNKLLLYKSYSNKLTHLKKISKFHFYNSLFNEHRDNKTETWKIIHNLISKNKRSSQQNIPETIAIAKNKYKTNTEEFANLINNHFPNKGENMAAKIPSTQLLYSYTFDRNILNNFVINGINKNKVIDSINCLRRKSTHGLHRINSNLIKLLKTVISTILNKIV